MNLFQEIENAKHRKLLDLLRRASANGTLYEVVAAIAKDWDPPTRIDGQGNLSIVMMDRDTAQRIARDMAR